MDVRISSFQVVAQGLVFSRDFGHRGRRIVIAGHSEFLAITIYLERLLCPLGCKLILRRSLRQRNQAIWK